MVFTSHASEDSAQAHRIVQILEQIEVDCWIASRDIPCGTSWPPALMQAIQSSDVVVVLVGARSATSQYVLREIVHSVNFNKHVVPVKLSNANLTEELTFLLSYHQWIEADATRFQDNLRSLFRDYNDLQDTGKPLPTKGAHNTVYTNLLAPFENRSLYATGFDSRILDVRTDIADDGLLSWAVTEQKEEFGGNLQIVAGGASSQWVPEVTQLHVAPMRTAFFVALHEQMGQAHGFQEQALKQKSDPIA